MITLRAPRPAALLEIIAYVSGRRAASVKSTGSRAVSNFSLTLCAPSVSSVSLW
jgi:hypothetical protein